MVRSTRARVADLHKLTLVGNARRIDWIVANHETVESNGYARDLFFPVGFGPDRNVVADRRTLVLN
jgi:hypothetical protein